MSSKKSRIPLVVAGVLWTAVLAVAAWTLASHGRKEYADFTVVEVLDGFTPTALEAVTNVSIESTGEVFLEASAQDGSYTIRLKQVGDPAKLAEDEFWLEEVGPLAVREWIKPDSDIARAVRRNLQRARDAGVVIKRTARETLAAAR